MKRFLFSKVITVGVMLLLVFAVHIETHGQAASQQVSGWAWSGYSTGSEQGGIGWISFTSRNCDNINNATGNANDPDGKSDGTAGCPASGTPVAAYGVTLDGTHNLT